MSIHTILFADDALRIECDDTDAIVRIVTRRHGLIDSAVSLHLDLAGIEAMETALAVARMNLTAQAARKAA